MRIVCRTTRLVCGTVASVALLVGCAPPPEAAQLPPSEGAAANEWAYAAYLLSNGDAFGARAYLEPLTESNVEVSDAALLWRDVAEARLFSGDLSGAVIAATRAREELGREPTTAQFNADDRLLMERTIDALAAAAASDLQRLQDMAMDDRVAPSADAWYLLGWLDEQHADLTGARTAYRAFLDRAPQWAFLRQAFEMRRHAQLLAVVK